MCLLTLLSSHTALGVTFQTINTVTLCVLGFGWTKRLRTNYFINLYQMKDLLSLCAVFFLFFSLANMGMYNCIHTVSYLWTTLLLFDFSVSLSALWTHSCHNQRPISVHLGLDDYLLPAALHSALGKRFSADHQANVGVSICNVYPPP